jgi:hypothetical protein
MPRHTQSAPGSTKYASLASRAIYSIDHIPAKPPFSADDRATKTHLIAWVLSKTCTSLRTAAPAYSIIIIYISTDHDRFRSGHGSRIHSNHSGTTTRTHDSPSAASKFHPFFQLVVSIWMWTFSSAHPSTMSRIYTPFSARPATRLHGKSILRNWSQNGRSSTSCYVFFPVAGALFPSN